MDTTQRFLQAWDALRHDWLADAPFPYGGAARGTALEGIVQFATCSPLEHLLLRRRNWAAPRPGLRVGTALSIDDALVVEVAPIERGDFVAWPAKQGGAPARVELLVAPLGNALVRHDTRDPWRIEEEWHRRACDLAAHGHALLVERLALDFELVLENRPVFVMERATRLRLERIEREPAGGTVEVASLPLAA